MRLVNSVNAIVNFCDHCRQYVCVKMYWGARTRLSSELFDFCTHGIPVGYHRGAWISVKCPISVVNILLYGSYTKMLSHLCLKCPISILNVPALS
jgi:hypothetical protein